MSDYWPSQELISTDSWFGVVKLENRPQAARVGSWVQLMEITLSTHLPYPTLPMHASVTISVYSAAS